MMSFALYLAFCAATVVLILIPGPNVSLIVANSIAYGTRLGLLTVAGTGSALVVQLLLTTLGMTAIMTTLAAWFDVLRWFGVAYLLWIGIAAWRAVGDDLTKTAPQPRSARAIFLRGFLVGATNPKTLLFYGAFFPQFIDLGGNVGGQIALLSVTFLVIGVGIDSVWAIAAGRARVLLAMRGKLRNRLTGGLLIGAGIGLALARRP